MVSTTRWSQIARAAEPGRDAGQALQELCVIWRPVVLGWLRRRSGPQEAEELTHAFLLHLLESALVARADRTRGRFRQFMFHALQQWWLDRIRHAKAAKRSAPHVDEGEAEHLLVADDDPAEEFDRAWARLLLQRAYAHLAADAEARGRKALFDAAAPFLYEAPDQADYTKAAAQFGMRPNTFAVAVSRLRQRLRAAVRREVADTTGGLEGIEAELHWLRAALRD
jgi:DNA-directed RNA polymerase specialized sigma24 family protein